MDDGDDLVLAVPRRGLWGRSGFSARPDFAVLEELAGGGWWLAPGRLRGNPDAKEVRVGVIVLRPGRVGSEVLLAEDGVLVQASPVPASAGGLGHGLAGLRTLAAAAAARLLGLERAPVELAGWLCDDALPECRDLLLLVYRLRAPAGTAAPAGFSWVRATALSGLAIDPVGALCLPALEGER